MIRKSQKYFSEIICMILSLLVLVPLYMLLINSFKTSAEADSMGLGLPAKWNIIENYSKLFKAGGIIIGFKTSIIVTFWSVAVVVLISAMAAFIFQRRKTKLSGIFFSAILLGLIVPRFTITQYFVVHTLHLTGGYISGILVYITSAIPLCVFLFTGFYKSIPRELDESAILDGCGPFNFFFRIILPLVKPVTVTAVIICFLSFWNDFATAIWYLNAPKRYTITLTMFTFYGIHSADWNLVFADIVVISIPVIALYLAMQKYFVEGMTAGAVKG